MDGKPKVIAWMMDAPVADDDPYRAVKLRARDIGAAAEVLDQVTRKAEAGARAARLDEAAALLTERAFDPMETWDAARAAGLSEPDLDAAAHVAVTLRQIELDGP